MRNDRLQNTFADKSFTYSKATPGVSGVHSWAGEQAETSAEGVPISHSPDFRGITGVNVMEKASAPVERKRENLQLVDQKRNSRIQFGGTSTHYQRTGETRRLLC